jgi:dihydroorotase
MCHVSTKAAVNLIYEYNRSSSYPVTCEVTPHHVFFSVNEKGVSAQTTADLSNWSLLDCNPPLRSEQDRLFLIDALKNGTINILATDHAPHTLQDKANGAPGMPHLDTLGAFVGWLLQTCGFTPHRISEILCSGPVRLFQSDLQTPHGAIEPGAIASFTILDFGSSTQVEETEIIGRGPLQTRCKWSPFSGMSFPAQVKKTIVRGKELWSTEVESDPGTEFRQ